MKDGADDMLSKQEILNEWSKSLSIWRKVWC